MLQIMIVLSAASLIVLKHPAVLVFRFWAGTVFRLVLGFTVATLVYFGVLYVVVDAYTLNRPLGATIYGTGFVIATLLGTAVGTLVSPARLARIIIPGNCAFAVLFPFGLNVYLGMTADWRPVYLVYLLGGVWGGYIVAWLTFRPHNSTRHFAI